MMIYLDYMATTPVDPRVIEVMQYSLAHDFGNPSSQHAFGLQAREKIHIARNQVASLINADSKEIIWTSGATESINLALKGSALFYRRQGNHIITMSTEHKAVLESCHYLESIGYEVSYLNPEKNGLLDLNKLHDAIRPDTILCSIMHVNNETGVIQDIAAIGKILHEKGVWFHVDAAQSVGKIPIDLKNLSVDLMSFASHKIYGPKGIGALYVRKNPHVQLITQMHGGDADNFYRAGTLPTHQIVGMSEAYRIAQAVIGDCKIRELRDQLWRNLSIIPDITINGDPTHRIAGCLNISIPSINTELFLKNISDVAISIGSACNAVDPEPSHVLMAMGLSRELANRSFRLSVGRMTTKKDIEIASERLIAEIQRATLKNNKVEWREV